MNKGNIKFFSPTGEPIQVALLSGHTAIVGEKPVELDARFHKAAIEKGCLAYGSPAEAAEGHMAGAKAGGEGGAPLSKEAKTEKIVEAIKGLSDADFTAGGLPKIAPLEKALGFGITQQERDEAFEIVKAELDEGDDGDE